MAFFNRDRMKLAAATGVAAVISVAALVVASANALPVGDIAPAFKEASAQGKEVQLADFKGKTVVLEWTNDGCPFVQKHYNSKNMQKTQEAATMDGAVWITVISSKKGSQGYSDAARANKLTADRGAHPDYVLLDADGSMGRAYGAKTTPHMFVITPEGKIAYTGAIDSIQSNDVRDIPKATNYVTAALASLKAGKAPDPALTVPYGCSVKY
ncbi:MAG TPA: redoxin family protein [Hyphomonadaceae bacterium]|nr:redoxin family protein [Hyphomonadaceae bacterium]